MPVPPPLTPQKPASIRHGSAHESLRHRFLLTRSGPWPLVDLGRDNGSGPYADVPAVGVVPGMTRDEHPPAQLDRPIPLKPTATRRSGLRIPAPAPRGFYAPWPGILHRPAPDHPSTGGARTRMARRTRSSPEARDAGTRLVTPRRRRGPGDRPARPGIPRKGGLMSMPDPAFRALFARALSE